MSFVTKPDRVKPKEKILAETINKLIEGLEDIERYLEGLPKLVEDHIEYGKVVNIDTSSTGHFTFSVSFRKPFTILPHVFLTLENVNVNVDLFVWVSSVTLTGFVLNVKITRRERYTSCNVNWLALA